MGWRPGAFHTPPDSIAGVGGSWGGWGPAGGRGAGHRPVRAPHDGLSSGVPSVVLRLDSPMSLILVGVVDQPIEHGVGQGGVADGLMPAS